MWGCNSVLQHSCPLQFIAHGIHIELDGSVCSFSPRCLFHAESSAHEDGLVRESLGYVLSDSYFLLSSLGHTFSCSLPDGSGCQEALGEP